LTEPDQGPHDDLRDTEIVDAALDHNQRRHVSFDDVAADAVDAARSTSMSPDFESRGLGHTNGQDAGTGSRFIRKKFSWP